MLILFAFMLSGRETLAGLKQYETRLMSLKNLPAILLSALFFMVLVNVIVKVNPDKLYWTDKMTALDNVITPVTDTTGNIGVNLMTHYLLPFEAVSVLLLMALVGAAHLARKEEAP